MDLAIEFKKLKDGQDQILNLIAGMKSPSKTSVEIFSLDDLAKIFKVTKRTIYNWKDCGIMPCVIVGSKTYVTQDQLTSFLKSHEIKAIGNYRRVEL